MYIHIHTHTHTRKDASQAHRDFYGESVSVRGKCMGGYPLRIRPMIMGGNPALLIMGGITQRCRQKIKNCLK